MMTRLFPAAVLVALVLAPAAPFAQNPMVNAVVALNPSTFLIH